MIFQSSCGGGTTSARQKRGFGVPGKESRAGSAAAFFPISLAALIKILLLPTALPFLISPGEKASLSKAGR